MDRRWLQGQLGDALHAVLCATGYNLRWLLRAMVRLGLNRFLCARYCWRCWLRLKKKPHTLAQRPWIPLDFVWFDECCRADYFCSRLKKSLGVNFYCATVVFH
jgi:hypothetical protein